MLIIKPNSLNRILFFYLKKNWRKKKRMVFKASNQHQLPDIKAMLTTNGSQLVMKLHLTCRRQDVIESVLHHCFYERTLYMTVFKFTFESSLEQVHITVKKRKSLGKRQNNPLITQYQLNSIGQLNWSALSNSILMN